MNHLLACILLAAMAASAQSNHTWVSGLGDDLNPCTRTAPCATFNAALALTNENGTVTALDPGEFPSFTIDKSVTIDGGDQRATITASDQFATIIQADATSHVVLRRLRFSGSRAPLDPATFGIALLGSSAVLIEDCSFNNFALASIYSIPVTAAPTSLLVRNASFNSGLVGVFEANPVASTVLKNTTFANNSVPVATAGFALQLIDSELNGSKDELPCVYVLGATKASIFNSTLENCTSGLLLDSGASAFLSGNVFFNNQNDISAANGSLVSAGNNVFTNLATSITFTRPPFTDVVPQTIDFPALSTTQPFTGTPIPLVATATSGLPVIFSSATPSTCTASGSTLVLLRPGHCAITASQPGNSVYAPAASVTRGFAITPGAPAILSFAIQPTAGNAGQPFVASPSIQVLDSFGNLNPAGSIPITLSIASGTPNAQLRCGFSAAPITISTTAGIATLGNCEINLPGTYVLTASSPGLTSVNSIAFRIFEVVVPPAFSFNTSSLQLNATAGNPGSLASVLLFNNSSSPWRFTTMPAWLKVEQRNTDNPSLFWLTADATNLAPGSYSAQLLAEMPAFQLRTSIELRLTVLPCAVSLNPDRLTLRPDQTSAGILAGAEKNCAWAPVTSANWIKITAAPTSGTGNVAFVFEPNFTGQTRGANVSFLNTQLLIVQPPSKP